MLVELWALTACGAVRACPGAGAHDRDHHKAACRDGVHIRDVVELSNARGGGIQKEGDVWGGGVCRWVRPERDVSSAVGPGTVADEPVGVAVVVVTVKLVVVHILLLRVDWDDLEL